MATLENGENDAKSSRRGISFQFQSKDLPSRRLLGKGLSGIAYETTWKGARYARKDFVGVQRDIFLQEATVLVGLKDHKNIVKTYGWTIDKRSCSLVLEYVDEDLLSLLQKRMDSKRGVFGKDLGKQSSSSTSTQPVDLPEAVDMMLQIATGMEYLHEQGFAHGDLKTKNILVTHRKDGDQSLQVLKLSDYGLVGTKRKSRYIVSRKVRKLDMVRWKSPESLRVLSRRLDSSNGDDDETSSESESEFAPSSFPEVSPAVAGMRSDVYSFALICSQILTGQSPYPYLGWKELMVKVLSGFRPGLPDSCHPVLRELLLSCWGDPAERPSFFAVRMKLKRIQVLLTTAMGKRPQESAAPSVADCPAHPEAFGSLVIQLLPSPKPIQSEERLEEALLRDSMAKFDPSVKKFLDLNPVTQSSALGNDLTIGRGSNLADMSMDEFLKEFCKNEEVYPRIWDTPATVVKAGTMDTVERHAFNAWKPTGVLPLFMRGREKSTNQSLLRRCLHNPTLPSALRPVKVQSYRAASRSTVSQGPRLTSALHHGFHRAPVVHKKGQREGGLHESFVAKKYSVRANSKLQDDEAVILDDAATYLEDMKREIRSLKMNMSFMESRCKDLEWSHQVLEQRTQKLEASKSQLQRQCKEVSLQLSHSDFKQGNKLLEATKSRMTNKSEQEELPLGVPGQQDKLLEATKNPAMKEYERKAFYHEQPCMPPYTPLETREKHPPTVVSTYKPLETTPTVVSTYKPLETREKHPPTVFSYKPKQVTGDRRETSSNRLSNRQAQEMVP